MNADDRDIIVERALKQAMTPGAEPPATPACLDAETMAAWLDGGLDRQSMAMAETHASTCARCQALLATVVRTIPVASGEAPAPAGLWRWWFAPLAAGVAATTLWMVVPAQPPVPPPTMNVASAPAGQEMASAPSRDRAGVPPASALASEPKLREAAPKLADSALNKATQAPAADAAEGKAEGLASGARANNEAERAEFRASAELQAPAAASEQALGQARRQAPAIEIVSPDMSSRWRIEAGGAVEHSTDGGATWQRVESPGQAELTAGSSPSADVCWLVGRGGTVLVTVDGRTFSPVSFPEAVDLVAVRATSAAAAAVTTADGRTFLTADAGKSWQEQ